MVPNSNGVRGTSIFSKLFPFPVFLLIVTTSTRGKDVRRMVEAETLPVHLNDLL